MIVVSIVLLSIILVSMIQVVDQSDLSWWQAQVVGSEDRKVGLIPSQDLEERRKAFVPQEYDYVHKIGICGTRVIIVSF